MSLMKSTHSQGSFRCTGCRILQHLKRPEIFEFPFKARFSQDIQAQMKPLIVSQKFAEQQKPGPDFWE